MKVAELRRALDWMPGDLEVLVEAPCFDDPYYVGLGVAVRVVREDRGDGFAVYITAESGDEG